MEIPDLVLAGPDSIVSSIPFVIGFTPIDSLVVMWLDGACLRLTMRVDLPPADVAPDDYADAVMRHRGSSDEVILAVVLDPSSASRDAHGELVAQGLITALLDRLRQTDCQVRDALLQVDDRWWSYLCPEPECCSPSGTPLDSGIAEEVAARFALAGVARLPDRGAVVAICAADPARQALVGRQLRAAHRRCATRISAAEDPRREFEAWRDDSIAEVLAALTSTTGTPPGREGEVLWALCDVRVRDTVLWEIAGSLDHDAHRAFESAAALLRAAPGGAIAPIGAVTGLLAWLIGDGVRAVAALDRVNDEDPDYALAELLHRSITAGLSPSSWLAMMRQLSRDACRARHRDSVPAA